MKKQKLVAMAALMFATNTTCNLLDAVAAVNPSGTDLKTDKLKSIVRREPRAQDAVPKVESRIEQWKTDGATAHLAVRLERELMNILMHGPGETEGRLKEDVNLLEAAAAANVKPPTAEELAPLQERYAKFAGSLDDSMLVKDYDRLLKKHDRFIRYTSLGLWDKDKIASELQKLEEMMSNAPDMALGRAELLRGLQNRRLASVKNLVYLGTYPHEEMYLSPDRRSLGILEEGLGGTTQIETTDLTMQNPDGSMVDLSTANNPMYGMPFAPPLSAWMKARMLEGRVPAITFRLPDTQTIARFAAYNPNAKLAERNNLLSVQDVIDGKLDDYMKKNLGIIASTKEAAIVGLFENFDRELAQNSFGTDGKTPFYLFDQKLAKIAEAKPCDGCLMQARQEYLKRAEKGTYASDKSLTPEMSNKYGDPNIPDGPERVRDAWKHFHQLIGNTTPNIAYYSSAGAYHGSKTAFKFPDLSDAGTQAWNKLEYYWPGEGVLDWVGVEAIGPDPAEAPKGPNITDSIDQFFVEARSSNWQQTPIMLRGVGLALTPTPSSEAAWIPTVFQKLIKGQYSPTTSIVFVDVPERLTLWTRESSTAYRTNVASDKFYKWPLRFKMLDQPTK